VGMHDGLLATIVRLLRWQELAMTNLWWCGCGWECLVWMRDRLLAAIVGLLRWQELAMTAFFVILFFSGAPGGIFVMTNLWWWGSGWECLARMHDGLLAAIVGLLRW
jgi:hypothetical protein